MSGEQSAQGDWRRERTRFQHSLKKWRNSTVSYATLWCGNDYYRHGACQGCGDEGQRTPWMEDDPSKSRIISRQLQRLRTKPSWWHGLHQRRNWPLVNRPAGRFSGRRTHFSVRTTFGTTALAHLPPRAGGCESWRRLESSTSLPTRNSIFANGRRSSPTITSGTPSHRSSQPQSRPLMTTRRWISTDFQSRSFRFRA